MRQRAQQNRRDALSVAWRAEHTSDLLLTAAKSLLAIRIDWLIASAMYIALAGRAG